MAFTRHRKLLGPTGLDVEIDENTLYTRATDGTLTIWNGQSVVNSRHLIIKGKDRFARKEVTETTAQDMIIDRNITSLDNKVNDVYNLSGIIQGVWAAPGVESGETITTGLQLNDINAIALTVIQRVRIRLSTSVTDPAAGVPAGLTLTSTVGTIITGDNTGDLIVDSTNIGDITIVTTDALAGALTGFLHMLKSDSDTSNNLVIKSISSAITFA